ncbi:DUF4133 domain-containing protein [Chitinophaga varians]|uniref:DUF4133 domain-containing protein n=1 Tax=Chitinophaga varians TaxID=2202339 RepID=UPI00165F6A09|nr:DUF4133 domain-containing protein [Chitinophaga varians]MBC9909116.1 DUF4133 domain-containing protein [Chitinophaga varians]
MATVYEINKGINRSVEFKGIKAQYIVYLAVGMVGILLLFAIVYLVGINIYCCVTTVLIAGYALFNGVQRYSKKYGENGLVKKAAQIRLPGYVITTSRKLFIQLSVNENEEDEKSGRSLSYL